MTHNLVRTVTRALVCAIILWISNARAGDVSVGQANGQAVFVQNGQPVSLRGVNYDITVPNLNPSQPGYYHAVFDPCYNDYTGATNTYPNCYGDGSQAEAAIRYIHGSGYNYIRVFLSSNYVNQGFTFNYNPNSMTYSNNQIPPSWWNNIADFLQRASNNGMRVVLTGEYAPQNFVSPFGTSFDVSCSNGGSMIYPCSTGENNILFNTNYASAYATFFTTLLADLSNQQTWPNAFSAIMAIDVKNELNVRSDQMPLSNQSLTSLQIDNGTYNMSDFSYEAGSRQVLIDDLTKNFSVTMTNAIRQADPTHSILVGISVVPSVAENGASNAVGGANGPSSCASASEANCIFPVRHEIMALYGQLDYSDIHLYPQYNNSPYSESQALASAGLTQGEVNQIPLLMGEFGALRTGSNAWPDAQTAASGLQAHIAASCSYGFNGWGLWTWSTQNTNDATQWWSAIILNPDGTQNSAAINGALAPAAWSPPC